MVRHPPYAIAVSSVVRLVLSLPHHIRVSIQLLSAHQSLPALLRASEVVKKSSRKRLSPSVGKEPVLTAVGHYEAWLLASQSELFELEPAIALGSQAVASLGNKAAILHL